MHILLSVHNFRQIYISDNKLAGHLILKSGFTHQLSYWIYDVAIDCEFVKVALHPESATRQEERLHLPLFKRESSLFVWLVAAFGGRWRKLNLDGRVYVGVGYRYVSLAFLASVEMTTAHTELLRTERETGVQNAEECDWGWSANEAQQGGRV